MIYIQNLKLNTIENRVTSYWFEFCFVLLFCFVICIVNIISIDWCAFYQYVFDGLCVYVRLCNSIDFTWNLNFLHRTFNTLETTVRFFFRSMMNEIWQWLCLSMAFVCSYHFGSIRVSQYLFIYLYLSFFLFFSFST